MIAGSRSWLAPGPLKRGARDEQLGSHLHQHTSSRAARHATLDQPSGSQRNAAGPLGHALVLNNIPLFVIHCMRFRREPCLHQPAQPDPGSATCRRRGSARKTSVRRIRAAVLSREPQALCRCGAGGHDRAPRASGQPPRQPRGVPAAVGSLPVPATQRGERPHSSAAPPGGRAGSGAGRASSRRNAAPGAARSAP